MYISNEISTTKLLHNDLCPPPAEERPTVDSGMTKHELR